MDIVTLPAPSGGPLRRVWPTVSALFGAAVTFLVTYDQCWLTLLGSALSATAGFLAILGVEALLQRRDPGFGALWVAIALVMTGYAVQAQRLPGSVVVSPPSGAPESGPSADPSPTGLGSSGGNTPGTTKPAPPTTPPRSGSRTPPSTAGPTGVTGVAVGTATSPAVAGGAAQVPGAAVVSSQVKLYDNWGEPATGHAMCRGNPARPESMPGGTVTQTLTVPGGVSTMDGALVQIDPDAQVTAHAQFRVNGATRATADAVAAGDTTFSFGRVAVAPGDTVTIVISFTATYGKIITVYTTGSPGGTFTTGNSCSDGAPSGSVSPAGLRAVVYGWSG